MFTPIKLWKTMKRLAFRWLKLPFLWQKNGIFDNCSDGRSIEEKCGLISHTTTIVNVLGLVGESIPFSERSENRSKIVSQTSQILVNSNLKWKSLQKSFVWSVFGEPSVMVAWDCPWKLVEKTFVRILRNMLFWRKWKIFPLIMEKMEKVYRVLYNNFCMESRWWQQLWLYDSKTLETGCVRERLSCEDSVCPILILGVFLFISVAIRHFLKQTSSVSL